MTLASLAAPRFSRCSCALAGVSCFYSKAGGPGSFFIVTLHFFTKILQFFGTSLDTKKTVKFGSSVEPKLVGDGGSDSENGSEDDAGLGKKVSSVGNLRKAFSVIQEVEVDEEDDEESEEEEEEDEFGKSLSSSPAKGKKKSKSKSPAKTSPATTRSKRSNTALVRAIPKDLKASIIQKHKEKVEGKRAKSRSSVLKPKIMFNGFARFGTGEKRATHKHI